MSRRSIGIVELGRRPYRDVLALQRALREARLGGRLDEDLLLLVEHDPVFTLGRSTRESSLPVSESLLRHRGADVIEVERGGDVTWHGPGQLVAYPIFDLQQHRQDLHWYLRSLEEVLLTTLSALELQGATMKGKTGAWIGERKIASIGIHIRRWVTLHGLALNVDPDLAWFSAIVPCGIPDVEMTSVAQELGVAGTPHGLATRSHSALVAAFEKTFGVDAVEHELDEGRFQVEGAAEPCDSPADRATFRQHG